MIENIKLKAHKGITDYLKLNGLGHVNVVCGKNNSGKSSIAEAAATKSKYFLGITIRETEILALRNIFEPMAKHYASPSPKMSMSWFENEMRNMINHEIYSDDLDRMNKEFGEKFRKATNHSPDTFKFSKIFEQHINNKVGEYLPILIPPIRQLACKASLGELNREAQADGGILYKLFHLSTQNNRSKDYKTYEILKNSFKEITSGCDFHINVTESNAIEIHFLSQQGEWIAADSSGLGLRDILTILSYMLCYKYSFLIIEEPENHIHPDMQRKLLRFMKTQRETQFCLTTHSNVFLDTTYVDKIFYVEMSNGGVTVSDETDKTTVLQSLGYSVIDNFVSDLIVLTEGPFDIMVLREICSKLDFLHRHNVRFYPLGGDIMHHVDLSVFAERSKVMALVDADPGSKTIREEFQEKCKANDIPCIKLSRYSIENYFTLAAIRAVYPHQCIDENITELMPNKKVENQIGFSVKKGGGEIAKKMCLQDFEGTDLLRFCMEIKTELEKSEKIKGIR